MNIGNIKKLTVALLACALVVGGAVGASATEPSKESDNAVSATMTKAITMQPATTVETGDQMQKLRITRIDRESSDGIEISVVPLTAIVEEIDVNDYDQVTIKALSLIPAKAVPMEKIVME